MKRTSHSCEEIECLGSNVLEARLDATRQLVYAELAAQFGELSSSCKLSCSRCEI